MVISLVIVAYETVTHERTLIHRNVDYFLYILCMSSGYRIFGCLPFTS
jgi:hypothetical protein